jgi:hypothetical protein
VYISVLTTNCVGCKVLLVWKKIDPAHGQIAATMKNIFTGGLVQRSDAGKMFFILPDSPQAQSTSNYGLEG